MRFLFFFSLLSVLFWLPKAYTKPLQVISSIKPVGLIVKAIAGDSGEKVQHTVLLSVQASPHEYALKVSDMKRLTQVDLVVWVGPNLETFLRKPLTGSARQLVWVPDFDHAHVEPHPWLSLSKTLVFAERLAKRLSALQPESADYFAQNLKRFQLDILALDAELMSTLAQKPLRFISQHDAYQELLETYRLQQLGIILPGSGKQPGPRHIKQLRDIVKQDKLDCLLGEYGHSDKWLRLLDKNKQLNWVFLDPLAQQSDLDSYLKFYRQLQQGLNLCRKKDSVKVSNK